jgi:Family of unknown function (DUF6166)
MAVFCGRLLMMRHFGEVVPYEYQVWRNGKRFPPRSAGREAPVMPKKWTWGADDTGSWSLAWWLLYESIHSTKAADRWANDLVQAVVSHFDDCWVLDTVEIAESYAHGGGPYILEGGPDGPQAVSH